VDNYQFVASLVSSLAWPVAVVIVAIVFRAPIGEMIKRLEHVKSPLFEGWAKATAETRVALATGPSAGSTTGVRGSLTEKFADLAATSPAGAVVMGWIEVEKLLSAKMVATGLPEQKFSGVRAPDAALQAGLISQETAEAIRGLATLRNLAAHGRVDDLDHERAMDFLTLADGVMFAISHEKAKRG